MWWKKWDHLPVKNLGFFSCTQRTAQWAKNAMYSHNFCEFQSGEFWIMDSVASFKVVLVVSQHHYFGETKFSEFGGTFPNFNLHPQLGPRGPGGPSSGPGLAVFIIVLELGCSLRLHPQFGPSQWYFWRKIVSWAKNKVLQKGRNFFQPNLTNL